MKLKAKILRRFTSMVCAISMSTSLAITSAGAIDTTDAEAVFSMQYMDLLPKPNETNFDKLSGKYERDEIEDNKYTDTLKYIRKYDVNYPDYESKYKMEKNILGEKEKVYDSYHINKEEIKEKDVYNQIKQQVEALKDKVKKRTPDNGMIDDDIAKKILSKEISKHHDMPEKMRLAKAIYRWVAKEIPYDFESLAKGKNPNTGEKKSLRKPQDPLYVFASKTGVCAGKANLLNLMMRLADIPSAVIVSRTHAFNAVYLKDTNNNRQGWVLLDPTWGAPKSDKSLQTGVETNNDVVNKEKEKENINRMIKGTTNISLAFMKNIFSMDDEYAKKIIKMTFEFIKLGRCSNKTDAQINEFNEELKRKLEELNANTSGRDGFKLNKIKIIRNDNGKCLVEYETNVEQDKAEEFYKNVQEYRIRLEAKGMIETSDKKLATNNFEKLNTCFVENFNKINKAYNRATLKRSKEYYKEFKIVCENLLKKYKNELTNNINSMVRYKNDENNVIYQDSLKNITCIVNDMNQTIKSNIDILNAKAEYQDIVKIKSFTIRLDKDIISPKYLVDAAILVRMQFDLPLEDAIKAAKKQPNWSNMKEFFLGFYDKTLAFKYANENIIDWKAHKIEGMVFGNWHDEEEKNSVFDRKIDGITYKMLGPEGNKTLEVIGDEQNPLKNVKISPDIANLKVPLIIGKGIKSITLQGNEEINSVSNFSNLESIDASNSTRYVADEFALYEKNKNGSKGNMKCIFKRNFNGIEFNINEEEDNGQIKVKDIKIYDFNNKHKDVRLPKFLTQFNIPIKVRYGVESLILENDDIVDLSEARNLECVYINNSNKYMVENGVLYKKDKNGNKGNKVNVPTQIKAIDKTDKEALNNAKNEYQKMLQEYKNKQKEFMSWIRIEKIDDKDDKTRNTRMEVTKLFVTLNKKFDVNQAKEFIELAKETMDMMDKFKFDHTLEEYTNKHKEFIKWKLSKKIADNDDTTKNSRARANRLSYSLKKQFDINKAKEFIELAKETMDIMNKFKQEYEDYEFAKQLQEDLNNANRAG